jgi:OmpA-OmpF porin, OOP family
MIWPVACRDFPATIKPRGSSYTPVEGFRDISVSSLGMFIWAKGEVDRNGGDVRAQGANLSLVGSIPLADNFSILGKVGGIYGWTRTRTVVPGVPGGGEDGLGLSYGAGLQYDINRKIGLRADWDRYRLKFAGGNKDDADLYSVGLIYKF